MKKLIGGILTALIFASNAFAVNFCADTVIDETGKLSSGQIEQLTKVAEQLKGQSVDVRVRVLADMKGNPSLDALKKSAQEKCGSWKSQDGGMKNNLALFMVVPSQGRTGFYFGLGLTSKIRPVEDQINANMNAKFRDGNIAAGLVAGMTDVSDLMGVKISQQNVPVTINHATDVSGFSNVFGWIVFIFVIAGAIWLGLFFWNQKEKRRNAQSNAKSEQGRYTAAMNGFELPYATLVSRIGQSTASEQKKKRLLDRTITVRNNFDTVSGQSSSISRGENNPDVSNLSVAEYGRIAILFKQTADKLEALRAELTSIKSDLDRPEVPVEEARPAAVKVDSAPMHSPAPVAPSISTHRVQPPVQPVRREAPRPAPAPTPRPPVYTPAPAPTPPREIVRETTVINNGGNNDFLTGVIIGDMLGRDRHAHRDNDNYQTPPVAAPSPRFDSPTTPSEGNGGETSWGGSTAGSGRETSFGRSTDGGGGETRFSGADFGRETTTREEPPTRAEPSDCKPSDCRPSDCASSDCNCDCASSDCSSGSTD